MKEDLTQIMKKEFDKAIGEEKERLAIEFEEQYNQTILEQKVKIDELTKKVNTLSGEKDEWDQAIDALNEESKKQLSEIESMSNCLSHTDKYKTLRIVYFSWI